MNEKERFGRTGLLLGEAALERLAAARVLIVGIGGVGAYAAECVVRAGIGSVTIADGDTVEESNCNRQLPALESTIGKYKTDVAGARLLDINPLLRLNKINRFITAADADALPDGKYDFVIDAIDDTDAKTALIRACVSRGIPLVSAMGAGGKLDPAQVRIADISRTCGDALARTMRRRLRDCGVTTGVPCVFSPEPAHTVAAPAAERRIIGSISYLPAVFGCFCAAEAVRKITGER